MCTSSTYIERRIATFFITLGSMNSLFSDFLTKFAGVILGVFPTMCGDLGGVLRGNLGETKRREAQRGSQKDYSS